MNHCAHEVDCPYAWPCSTNCPGFEDAEIMIDVRYVDPFEGFEPDTNQQPYR